MKGIDVNETSGAVTVVAVFHPLPEAKEELVRILRAHLPNVHFEPGCELYSIHDAEDGTIVMIERWTTRAQLDAHSGGPAVAAMSADFAGLLAQPVTVNVMRPLLEDLGAKATI